MASGWGVRGGTGRCYPFWVDFQSCMKTAPKADSCACEREDYFECLHRRKEITRINQIIKEYDRLEKEQKAPKPPVRSVRESM
mmetsp:Transcript_18926/g.29582  ORF Transcript_18926/g.29582 Transcript_18926/m.29582 type:complete len:83 (+) Transcript_18926:26-274(+)